MPRVGRKRELKFATEKYWRQEITASELLSTATDVVDDIYNQQLNAGIDLIPVNDFSFYDRVLDLCCFLNIRPERFSQNVKPFFLDEYFRLARGDGEIAAMEMTKWFDTNYHYLVPEIEATTSPSFSDKLFAQQILPELDSKKQKFCLVGPVTFLALAKGADSVDKYSIKKELSKAYTGLLKHIEKLGYTNIQIEEPILGSDLSDQDKSFFSSFYSKLSGNLNPATKTHLVTYFGNIENNIDLISTASFDSVHLDLITDDSNLENLKNINCKNISLGVISGRNIWRLNWEKTLERIDSLPLKDFETIYLGPSTSLQHLPYSIELEKKIDDELLSWLAFAKEKISELALLANHFSNQSSEEEIKNIKAANETRQNSDRVTKASVRRRMSDLSEKDFERNSAFPIRQSTQKEKFNFPILPTTTIGSFPQTTDIRKARARLTKGEISKKEYETFMEESIVECIRIQEDLDLDVLVHGEPERNDMVQYFGELLSGFAFTSFGWVQSYGTRCVKPPIIFGDVERPEAMTVKWSEFAQKNTKKVMKGMLTGPVTILQWSFVRDDQPRKDTCYQIALSIRDEVKDLEDAGIHVIQVDEAAFREGLPVRRAQWDEYLKWAVDTFRLTTACVEDSTQIHSHMCYSEFNDVIENIAAMDADVISIECSRSNMELLKAFKDFDYPNEIGPGVWDIHSPRIPSQAEIESLIEKAKSSVKLENLWINPDCGLKTRGWPEVKNTIEHMVNATKKAREQLGK
jgi:5-methyltetrahydropteroyltriglutamate--homocysteine methyltransferase